HRNQDATRVAPVWGPSQQGRGLARSIASAYNSTAPLLEAPMNVHAPVTSPLASLVQDLIERQPPGHSLQQPFYAQQRLFEHDIERLFMRHWLCVGHASRAPEPGDFFLYELANESLIIVRGNDRNLRALVNVCRHRGSRVCTQSQGHATVLVCPYHA